jgi:hypothetical protein
MIYVPRVGDRVLVLAYALEALGVPPGVACAAATVVAVERRGYAVVKLGAKPWATPPDDELAAGYEVAVEHIWPIDLPSPSATELRDLRVAWPLVRELEEVEITGELGLGLVVQAAIAEIRSLRRQVLELERDLDAVIDSAILETSLEKFNVDGAMSTVKSSKPNGEGATQ